MEIKNDNCPCKRTKCERHQNCVACKEYHHTSQRKPLTTCQRIMVKEEKTKTRRIGKQKKLELI